MSDPVWTLAPALLVERIATVLPASASIALVRTPVRQVQIIDTDLSVVVRAVPSGRRWKIRAWAAESHLDAVTAELALEVLASSPEPATLETLMSLDDVLRAHSSSALKPAALWSYLRRVMEQARLTFDTAGLRAQVPALTVSRAELDPWKVRVAGVWDGFAFELKIQYGSASLTVGDSGSVEPLWFSGMYFELGEMAPSWEQVTPVLVTLAQRIERAPFVYLFTRAKATVEETPWESSGRSAQDAFENLLTRVSRLREQGYLVGGEFGAFDPVPLNRDERRFPKTLPAFEVRPAL